MENNDKQSGISDRDKNMMSLGLSTEESGEKQKDRKKKKSRERRLPLLTDKPESSKTSKKEVEASRVEEQNKTTPTVEKLHEKGFLRSIVEHFDEPDNTVKEKSTDTEQAFQNIVETRLGDVQDRMQHILNETEADSDGITEDESREFAADAALLGGVEERVAHGEKSEEAISKSLDEVLKTLTTSHETHQKAAENSGSVEDKDKPVDDGVTKRPVSYSHRSAPTPDRSMEAPPPSDVPPNRADMPPPPPGGGSPDHFGGSGGGHSLPDALTQPSAPDLHTPEQSQSGTERMNEYYRRDRTTGKVFLAGAAGYMLGRRGGRRRTEARLEPQIKERDTKIEDLTKKLDVSEQKIEKAARQSEWEPYGAWARKEESSRAAPVASERAPKNPAQVETGTEPRPVEASKPTPQESLAESVDQELRTLHKQEETFAEQLPVDAPVEVMPAVHGIDLESHTEQTPDKSGQNRRLAEAGAPIPLEADNPIKISETVTPAYQEKAAEKLQMHENRENEKPRKPEVIQPVEIKRDVQAMSMPEVLELADHIQIESTSSSLKELYEHRRIDAVNLRRVVAEYARGGKVESMLQHSLEAEEMQRELRSEIKTDDTAGGGPPPDEDVGGNDSSNAQSSEGLHTAAEAHRISSGSDIIASENFEDALNTDMAEKPLKTAKQAEEQRLMMSRGVAAFIGVLTGLLLIGLLFLYGSI